MQITRRQSFLPIAGLLLFHPSLKAGEVNNSNEYQIIETITSPEKIDTSKYSAYYKVNTRNEGSFYIVQKKDCRIEDAFLTFADSKERENGLIFQKSNDPSKLVAVVSALPLGMSGKFNVFQGKNTYAIQYDAFSALIDIPSHTTVSSKYLAMVDKGIRKLPQSLRQDLYRRGIKLMIGRNVEDTYYYYYPSWKSKDQSTNRDESKPWLEVKGDSCTDHRKIKNISALYNQKRVIIPQEHLDYISNKIIDRADSLESWTFDTIGHELGHAVDFFNTDDYYDSSSSAYSAQRKTYSSNGGLYYKQTAYSHDPTFLGVFKIDKERMESHIKEKVAYLWCKPEGGQQEGFADITASLIGGSNPEKTALTLNAFPLSAEHIRKKVLPDFGVNLSLDDVRAIYPSYLKDVPLGLVSN